MGFGRSGDGGGGGAHPLLDTRGNDVGVGLDGTTRGKRDSCPLILPELLDQ